MTIIKRDFILSVFIVAMLFLFTKIDASISSPTNNDNDTIKKFIPYILPWDDMPIDLFFVYKHEKPAGKYALKVEGDRFIFEDGPEARFWGTNFNSAQCFPSYEHSEKVEKRLAKISVNLIIQDGAEQRK